ncbi:metallophosphoesterase [Streptomyces sp. NBC_01808]|uniref:metallophosphoesterase family protein n=1 Tax=Streptomyces sp. NBC_01808 TaxID=2975947 RepID=UPI002DDA5B58|nr:metallophosphoesterase family protein [Streptomyces sp. NBC_01808]WSA37680.1 metallophosphoesterase [Streptomyces sp. NBC_01808]
MSRFRPSRAYQPELDVRFPGDHVPGWARPLVEGQLPNSAAWLVELPRRAGKTWLARAVERARAERPSLRVDLRSTAEAVRRSGLGCLTGGKQAPRVAPGCVVLVDEPAVARGAENGARTRTRNTPAAPGAPTRTALGGVDPAALAAGLEQVRDAGAVPVVFATPAEQLLLAPHLGADAPKDVLRPPRMTDGECARMAARAPEWAPAVVELLRAAEPAWLQTPFLLELALQTAEEHPALRADAARLATAAYEEACGRHQYVPQWFHDGLAPEHRAALRARRWHDAGVEIAVRAAHTPPADDPVLVRHLPDVLRIHHVTDLHHGGGLRANVDAKDTSQAGQRLAELAGAGSPLDAYLDHVRQLADQGRAPHLIIATGDLVNRPVDADGETALAWLRALEDLLAGHADLRPGDPRVLLTGGNHDVSWELCLDEDPQARHRWFARVFAGYPHPDLHEPDTAARRVYVTYPDAGLRVALLGTAESGGEPAHDRDRERLERFRETYVAAADAADEDAVRRIVLEFERHDPGVIARGVLDRLTREPGYVTLAALHHPLSPVPAVEIAPYSGVVNAGQAKWTMAEAATSLVLHGHTHLGFTAAERLLGTARPWTTRIAGAPALGSRESDERNGYNEVFVAREGGDHALALRTVRYEAGTWTPSPTVGFTPGAPDETPLPLLCGDPA